MTLPLQLCGACPSGQIRLQSPLPVQDIRQSPAQCASQLLLLGQSMKLPMPTRDTQFPDPVQLTLQPSPHVKSQAPDPAH